MQNPMMAKNKSEEEIGQDYGDTPLGSICATIDGFIEKGGASKEELTALKQSVEEVRADVDGEGEADQSGGEEDMPMGHGKPGSVMIAIGFKKHKGEKE